MSQVTENGRATSIDLRYAKDLGCPQCNGLDFYNAARVKKLPKLAYGLQRDELVLVDSMVCSKCGFSITAHTDLKEVEKPVIISSP